MIDDYLPSIKCPSCNEDVILAKFSDTDIRFTFVGSKPIARGESVRMMNQYLIASTKESVYWEWIKDEFYENFDHSPPGCYLVWLKDSERGEVYFRFTEEYREFAEKVYNHFMF